MSKCVQCQEEMELYGYFQGEHTSSFDGRIAGVITPVAFRCLKPECPNFNSLQGELSTNQQE